MAKAPKTAEPAVTETPAPEAPAPEAAAPASVDERTQLEMQVGAASLSKWQAERSEAE